MRLQEVYQRAIDALRADSWVVANAVHIEVIEGVHAQTDIQTHAERFATAIADNRFVVIVEQPGVVSMNAVETAPTFRASIALVVIENPTHRATGAPTILDAVQEIATALVSAPANHGTAPGRLRFEPSQEFISYQGTANGAFFHRLLFTHPCVFTSRPFIRVQPV